MIGPIGDDVDAGCRYEKFFHGANDKFEVQRGLNNVFAYDLVPSVKVCEAALRACRRGTPFPSGSPSHVPPDPLTFATDMADCHLVADYSTSVRIFEALREKTENKTQYEAYCNELKPVREELGTPHSSIALGGCLTWCVGILMKEEMWPGVKW